MSDVNIVVENLPINITVAENGIQGIPGADGASGPGGSVAGVTGLNVTGFGGQTGLINFSGLGIITIFTGIDNFILISGSTSNTNIGISIISGDLKSNYSSGIGISGYIAKFNESSGIVNSIIYESGGMVGINTLFPSERLVVDAGNIVFKTAGQYGLKWPGGTRIYEQTTLQGVINRFLIQANGDRFEVFNETGGFPLFACHGTNSATPSRNISYNGLSIGDGDYITTAPPTLGSIIKGSLGIGNTSPIAKLDVSGHIVGINITGYNIEATNTLTISGQSVITGLDTSALATTINLYSTGSTLYNDIIGLSGVLNGDINNLYSTGATLYNLINNFSGVFNNSGIQYQTQLNTLTSNLTVTGVTLGSKIDSLSGWINNTPRVSALNITGFGNQTGIINISGLGTVTTFTGNNNFIYISGTAGASSDHSDGINLSGNLSETGKTLYGYITNTSGIFNDRLYQTGVNIIALINASAGGVSTLNGASGIINITGTGNVLVISGAPGLIYISGNNNDGINLSGNLYNTGSTLYNLVNNFSGVFNASGTQYQTQINTLTSNLTTTGVTLGAKVDSLSGYLNARNSVTGISVSGATGITGLITLTGYGTISLFPSGTFIGISGSNNNAINLSGNLTSTGQALYNYITNTSGNFDTRIYQTGSNLYNLINNFSGVFNNSGAAYQTQINTLTSNLTTTGVTLGSKIDSLSGFVKNTSINVTGFGQQTGVIGFSGAGGILVSTGSGGFIYFSGSNYYPSGQNPSGYIVPNQTGQFYPASNPTGFITIRVTGTTVQTGLIGFSGAGGIIVSSGSGNFIYFSGDPVVLAQTSNLYSTGSNLYNYIIGLSGVVTGNYINFQTSGSNLYNLINNFSGVFNNSGVQYQTQLNTLTSNLQSTGVSLKSSFDLISGNLITTGQTLDNKVNSLSGYVKNTSISVTGFSPQTGLINFSGKGSVTIFTGLNNSIFISGSASGPGGGVSTLNGLDGDITLVGTNGTTITPVGQNIEISAGAGSSAPSGTYIFRQFINNGVNKQFINFPFNLTGTPIVIASLHNEIDNTILPCQISGAVPTGFWVILPNDTTNTGYMINVIATSTGTGFASNVFIQNNNYTITGMILDTLITGSGTLNYIPKFTSNQTGLINSFIFDNNGLIGINTNTPISELDVRGSITTQVGLENTLISGSGNFNDYIEFNIQNFNTGQSASSDIVATSNVGNANNYYINLGINSSKYTGNFIGLTGDSYLFSKSNDMFIGNTVLGKKVHFFAETTPTGTNSGVFSISSGAMTVNTALFISGNPVTPFVSGSGIVFSNFNNNPTINTRMHENSGIGVSGAIAISANNYSSVASGNYVAGGWLFIGNVTAIGPTMTKFVLNARLWDNVSAGQTYYMGQTSSSVTGGIGSLGIAALPFTQFVQLTGTTNLVSLSCTANANVTIAVIPSGNLVAGTPSGITTYMRGIRLY